MPLVVDTGVLYALADRSDAWHERARTLVESANEFLVMPITVLPEVCYLLATRLNARAERSFLASILAGELTVDHLGPVDLARAGELLGRYPEIGLVDATVVALAERLKQSRIATTDRRHFSQIQPKHRSSFELVP